MGGRHMQAPRPGLSGRQGAGLDGDRREWHRHRHVWEALRQDTSRKRRPLGDSAYCSSANCKAAAAKGRDPYFEPKKSYNGNGITVWAKMVKLWKEYPSRFYNVYKARTTAEAAFFAIKGRFAYCVRSVTIHIQERELAIVSICRNIGPDGPWEVKINWLSPIVWESAHRLPIGPVPDNFGRFSRQMRRERAPIRRPNGLLRARRGPLEVAYGRF